MRRCLRVTVGSATCSSQWPQQETNKYSHSQKLSHLWTDVWSIRKEEPPEEHGETWGSKGLVKPGPVASSRLCQRFFDEITFVLIYSKTRAQKKWLLSGIWSVSHHLSDAKERSGLAAGTHGRRRRRHRRRWKWVTGVYWWCDRWGEQDFIFSHHSLWLTALPALVGFRNAFCLLSSPGQVAQWKQKRGVWLNEWLFIKMNGSDIFNGLFF